MVMVVMMVVLVLPVMFTTIGCDRQLAVEIWSDQFWQACLGQPRPHGDAMASAL